MKVSSVFSFSNDSLPETLQSIVTLHKIDLETPANIVVARDTRLLACIFMEAFVSFCNVFL